LPMPLVRPFYARKTPRSPIIDQKTARRGWTLKERAGRRPQHQSR